eukprot:4556823-Amphidinium_carterae.1
MEFADTATQLASQRYPIGIGNIKRLTQYPMPVRFEHRTFIQLEKYDSSVIVFLDDEDIDCSAGRHIPCMISRIVAPCFVVMSRRAKKEIMV